MCGPMISEDCYRWNVYQFDSWLKGDRAPNPCVITVNSILYFVALQQAVLVQPLTQQQIDEYLRSAGQQLEAVRQVLSEDPEFRLVISVYSHLLSSCNIHYYLFDIFTREVYTCSR